MERHLLALAVSGWLLAACTGLPVTGDGTGALDFGSSGQCGPEEVPEPHERCTTDADCPSPAPICYASCGDNSYDEPFTQLAVFSEPSCEAGRCHWKSSFPSCATTCPKELPAAGAACDAPATCEHGTYGRDPTHACDYEPSANRRGCDGPTCVRSVCIEGTWQLFQDADCRSQPDEGSCTGLAEGLCEWHTEGTAPWCDGRALPTCKLDAECPTGFVCAKPGLGFGLECMPADAAP